jgi:hypothetical protein
MKDELCSEDIELVILSLRYYKTHIQNDLAPREYQEKRQRLLHVESLIAKMRELRNDLRDNPA